MFQSPKYIEVSKINCGIGNLVKMKKQLFVAARSGHWIIIEDVH